MNYEARSPKPARASKKKINVRATSYCERDAEDLRRVQWISIGGLASNFRCSKRAGQKQRLADEMDIFFV